MKPHSAFLAQLLISTTLAACGGSDDPVDAGVNEWRGEQTHLAISGTYEDQAFDVLLEGEAAAGVRCDRYYAPLPGVMPDAAGKYDTSQVYFVMKELGAVIEIGGEPKQFSISYWRHDIAAGAELEVIPRTFGTRIPAGQTWSDINLFDPGTASTSGLESAAASGTVSMKLNSGSPDAGGIMVPSGGRTGEFISVSWGPRDNLNVSVTADCTTSPVATWPQTRLLP